MRGMDEKEDGPRYESPCTSSYFFLTRSNQNAPSILSVIFSKRALIKIRHLLERKESTKKWFPIAFSKVASRMNPLLEFY